MKVPAINKITQAINAYLIATRDQCSCLLYGHLLKMLLLSSIAHAHLAEQLRWTIAAVFVLLHESVTYPKCRP